jgi:hypothetical protein
LLFALYVVKSSRRDIPPPQKTAPSMNKLGATEDFLTALGTDKGAYWNWCKAVWARSEIPVRTTPNRDSSDDANERQYNNSAKEERPNEHGGTIVLNKPRVLLFHPPAGRA